MFCEAKRLGIQIVRRHGCSPAGPQGAKRLEEAERVLERAALPLGLDSHGLPPLLQARDAAKPLLVHPFPPDSS